MWHPYNGYRMDSPTPWESAKSFDRKTFNIQGTRLLCFSVNSLWEHAVYILYLLLENRERICLKNLNEVNLM